VDLWIQTVCEGVKEHLRGKVLSTMSLPANVSPRLNALPLPRIPWPHFAAPTLIDYTVAQSEMDGATRFAR